MTSSRSPRDVFVWIWLPDAPGPVVAGRLLPVGDRLDFVYGRSYLERADAIPLYLPELPLQRGARPPPRYHTLAGCLRDALPDAWGRRVLIDRLVGARGASARDVELDDVTLMLASGSNRTGAIDFQPSATVYEARGTGDADLSMLEAAASRVEHGASLPPDLALALFHGSSIGGARPKAALHDGARPLIAKFSSSSDTWQVVRAELVAMRLAQQVGLDVATVDLTVANGRDVLLVERFDRVPSAEGWKRRMVVSALTLLEEDEPTAHHASYGELADVIRARFEAPRRSLDELFGRMVFNVLVGNTDDHARNHAAFWDGHSLRLTPAYDICPQARPTPEANHALHLADGDRRSRLATCVDAAARFLLTPEQARARIDAMVEGVVQGWAATCDAAALAPTTRRLLAGRQFLNPSVFADYGPAPELR